MNIIAEALTQKFHPLTRLCGTSRARISIQIFPVQIEQGVIGVGQPETYP
jgi:hypothetical protein